MRRLKAGILEALATQPMDKRQLANTLHATPDYIHTLLRRLSQLRIIVPAGYSRANRGRRPIPIWKINPEVKP